MHEYTLLSKGRWYDIWLFRPHRSRYSKPECYFRLEPLYRWFHYNSKLANYLLSCHQYQENPSTNKPSARYMHLLVLNLQVKTCEMSSTIVSRVVRWAKIYSKCQNWGKILTGPTYELLLNFTVISYVSYGPLFSIKLLLPVLSYSVDRKAPCEHWNPVHNKSALVHIMARRWLGDKPYSELKPIQFIGANKRHYGIYLLCAGALALEQLILEKW